MTSVLVRTKVFKEIKQGHKQRIFKDFTKNKNHTCEFPHKYKYALTVQND